MKWIILFSVIASALAHSLLPLSKGLQDLKTQYEADVAQLNNVNAIASINPDIHNIWLVTPNLETYYRKFSNSDHYDLIELHKKYLETMKKGPESLSKQLFVFASGYFNLIPEVLWQSQRIMFISKRQNIRVKINLLERIDGLTAIETAIKYGCPIKYLKPLLEYAVEDPISYSRQLEYAALFEFAFHNNPGLVKPMLQVFEGKKVLLEILKSDWNAFYLNLLLRKYLDVFGGVNFLIENIHLIQDANAIVILRNFWPSMSAFKAKEKESKIIGNNSDLSLEMQRKAIELLEGMTVDARKIGSFKSYLSVIMEKLRQNDISINESASFSLLRNEIMKKYLFLCKSENKKITIGSMDDFNSLYAVFEEMPELKSNFNAIILSQFAMINVEKLAELLKDWTSLNSLFLESLDLTPERLAILVPSLIEMKELRHLSLKRNNLAANGIDLVETEFQIMSLVRFNKSIKTFDLGINGILYQSSLLRSYLYEKDEIQITTYSK